MPRHCPRNGDHLKIFYRLKEAKVIVEGWRQHYNTIRPHSALGHVPPAPEVVPWPAASTVALRPTMH